LCPGGLWIELLVTLDVGRQIGRPRLPVPNRRLNAARRLQGRGGVLLAYGYARSRQEGGADYGHINSETAQPVGRGASPARAFSHWISPAVRPPFPRTCCHG